MTDNLGYTEGSGKTVAADEIGGAHYQRLKLTLGADGVSQGDLAAGQKTMAGSVPVTMASDQTAIPVLITNSELVDDSQVVPASLYIDGEFGKEAVSYSSPLPVALASFSNELLGYNNGDPGLTEVTALGGTVVAIGPGSFKSGESVTFYLTNAFVSTHTIVFEQQNEAMGAWLTAYARDVTDLNNVMVSSAVGNGTDRIFVIPVYGPGFNFRVRCTVFSGGSFYVDARFSPHAASNQYLPLPPGSNTIGKVIAADSLVPFAFDFIDCNYTGDNLTQVIYKTGGAGGSTVATLTIAYTGSKIDTITRT